MKKPSLLPAWQYGDPCDVAERTQLQENAAAARKARQSDRAPTERQALRQRIHDSVFKKGQK